MWPVLLEWGGNRLYSYPLFLGLAWGIGYRLCEVRLPKDVRLGAFRLWFFGLFAASWTGAKLMYLATQHQWATSELIGASDFWLGGGFVFLGGWLAGAVYVAVLGLLYPPLGPGQIRFVLIPLLWAHAIGRLGCFLAGCCYGTETDIPWAVELHGAHRHPTQLYEAFLLACLAVLLNRRRSSSQLLPMYLLGYGASRWGLEWFRGDEVRGIWGSMSISQWLSCALIIGGLALYSREKWGRGPI